MKCLIMNVFINYLLNVLYELSLVLLCKYNQFVF